MESSAEGTAIGTERIQNIGFGFKHAGILIAAIELEVFTRISEGAETLEKIAEGCNMSMLDAERLTVALCALGLVGKKGDRYQNAADAEKYLVKGKPHYFGEWTRMGKYDFGSWSTLSERLADKADPSVLGLYERMPPEQAEMLTRAMYNVGLGSGAKLAKQFDFAKYNLVVDLGGGSGAYCVSLCNRFANLKAIVMDFPDVCRVTDELIAKAGLSDRIKTLAGDFTSDPFPEGADVMMLNGNIPQYGPEEAARIIKKAFDALLPGGAMHIIAENLNDDKTGPLLAATWSMHEAIFNSRGRAHSNQEIADYMQAAGFTHIEVVPFVHNVVDRVTGHKS